MHQTDTCDKCHMSYPCLVREEHVIQLAVTLPQWMASNLNTDTAYNYSMIMGRPKDRFNSEHDYYHYAAVAVVHVGGVRCL
jgi:hypothetical protein